MKGAKVVMIGLILSLVALNLAFAQPITNNVEKLGAIGEMERVWRWWAVDFSSDGNYAYVPGGYDAGSEAKWPSVYIVDVSDVTNPTIVQIIHIPNPDWGSPEAWDLQVVGNFLYVGAFKQGLWIYDITNPIDPVVAGNYTTLESEIRGLHVVGDYCYAGEAWNGFAIYNISDPANITRVALYNTDADISPGFPAEFHCGRVVDDVAYWGAGNHGLVMVDVSDPLNPEGISYAGECFISPRYPEGTYDWARGATAKGNLAFLGDNRVGLRIFDITVPTAPVEVGFYSLAEENAGEVWQPLISDDGTRAYIGYQRAGFIILDISDPTNPTKIGEYDVGTANVLAGAGLALRDNLIYLPDEKIGGTLHIIDITDDTDPDSIGTTAIAGIGRPWMVKIVANKLYVADMALPGLAIYDISDPTSPTFKGCAKTNDEAWDVAVVGTYAYVAGKTDGLCIFDISDPTSPEMVGHCVVTDLSLYGGRNSQSRGVKVSRGYAFVGDAWGGLTVIDVHDPTDPIKVANIGDPDMEGHRLDIDGDYCYVGGGRGIFIVDIFDPTAPTIIGCLKGQVTSGWSWGRGVRVFRDYAYYSEGLEVIDISVPSDPVWVNSYTFEAPAGKGWDNKEMSGPYGKYAFCAAAHGLVVADITHPLDPLVEAGCYIDADSIGWGKGIDVVPVADGFLVVLAGEAPNMIHIFQTTQFEGVEETPGIFMLSQSRPNPVLGRTEISYYLPDECRVELTVYDLTGRLVKKLTDGVETSGYNSVIWDGTDAVGNKVAPGVYFYRLEAGRYSAQKKLVILR